MGLFDIPTKKVLRKAVEKLSGGRIYSTANLKSTDEYRMSVWWCASPRYCRFEDVSDQTWEDCRIRANTLLREIINEWPSLSSNIRYNFHIASGIYLSLRVDNEVFQR